MQHLGDEELAPQRESWARAGRRTAWLDAALRTGPPDVVVVAERRPARPPLRPLLGTMDWRASSPNPGVCQPLEEHTQCCQHSLARQCASTSWEGSDGGLVRRAYGRLGSRLVCDAAPTVIGCTLPRARSQPVEGRSKIPLPASSSSSSSLPLPSRRARPARTPSAQPHQPPHSAPHRKRPLSSPRAAAPPRPPSAPRPPHFTRLVPPRHSAKPPPCSTYSMPHQVDEHRKASGPKAKLMDAFRRVALGGRRSSSDSVPTTSASPQAGPSSSQATRPTATRARSTPDDRDAPPSRRIRQSPSVDSLASTAPSSRPTSVLAPPSRKLDSSSPASELPKTCVPSRAPPPPRPGPSRSVADLALSLSRSAGGKSGTTPTSTA